MCKGLVNKTLKGLKKRLDTKNQLILSGRAGAVSNAVCKFNPPASLEEINEFEASIKFTLPEDYKDFLLLHNGSIIFDQLIGDIYVGGGLKIFSLDEMNKARHDLHLLPPNYLPIAHLLDGQYLVINHHCIKDKDPNYLFMTDLLEHTLLKLNFEIFLDRYIIAQGNNFWDWPIYTAKNYYRTHND